MKKIILYFLGSLAAFLLMEFACDLMKPIADAIPETEYIIGTLQTRTIVKSLWFLVIGTTFFIFFSSTGFFSLISLHTISRGMNGRRRKSERR